jgi:CubicO group peptidase (beta-lactamase class C family)
MVRLTAPLLAVVLFSSPAAGQASSALDSIDRYVKAEMARYRIPGLSVAVLHGDSVVMSRNYGFANLELRVPATDSTMYEVGSVTKQFTAAATVILAEQGRLSLDDPITRFLPEGSAKWRPITIRHLLTHTSGISDAAMDSVLDSRRDYTEGDLARLAAAQPLEFAPGDRWSYSSTGYVLLGIIIHRVTGQSYGDFLRDHLFHSVGMPTARVISEPDIVPNRADGYQLVNDTLKNQEWVSPSLNATADGGLLLSVRDLTQWAIALNHSRTPSQRGLDASWTPVRLKNGGTYPYGFGWDVTQQRGYRRIGHSGAYQGFQASIQRYPDFGLTVVVLDNLAQSNPPAMAFGIAGILEPALTPPHLLTRSVSATAPPEPIEHLAHDVAAGVDSARLASGFKAFISVALREGLGRRLANVHSWLPLGCDNVEGHAISRLGTRVKWICYSKGLGPAPNRLATVLYGPDWRAAGIDLYPF